jgi:hypothetical protein
MNPAACQRSRMLSQRFAKDRPLRDAGLSITEWR